MKDLGYQNLGFINLSIIYLTFGMTSTVAVPINKFLGTSLTLCLSALTYALWIASFLLPAYKSQMIENKEANELLIFQDFFIKSVVIISAVLIGLGAGPLWVSQSFYIS